MRVSPRTVHQLALVCALALAGTGCSDSSYTVLVSFTSEELAEDVDRVIVSLIGSCAEIRDITGMNASNVSGQLELYKNEPFEGLNDVEPGFYGFYSLGFDDRTGDCRIAVGCNEQVVNAGGTGILNVKLGALTPPLGCEVRDAGVEDSGPEPRDSRVPLPDVPVCSPTGSEQCNGNDDDCDGDVDEDFFLRTNTQRCGSCTNVCEADQGCADGVCAPAAVALALGAEHTCALRSDNKVLCWGGNGFGQLGLGSAGTGVNSATVIPNLDGVAQIAAGGNTTCARLQDGTARCWGANGAGQVGDGTFSNRATPSTVSALSNITQIGPAALHNCAVLQNGQVRCWGYNLEGELGNGRAGAAESSPLPVAVLNITNAVYVQGGYEFTCALTEDEVMLCWGRNNYGQLGNGTRSRSTTPVQVKGLTQVKSFQPGGGHVCAIRGTGEVLCWGDSTYGQVRNVCPGSASTPVATGITNGDVLSGGNGTVCVLLSDRTVTCWGGDNTYGELGNGTTAPGNCNPATLVVGLNDTSAISLAYADHHYCAIRSNRNVVCWGRNQAGQLGNALTSDTAHSRFVTVVGL